MLSKLKIPTLVIFISLFVLWAGNSIFSYFTHSALPEVSITGIKSDGYYSGTIECEIESENPYKIASISISLDNKVLDVKAAKKINAKNFNIPFKIDTTILEDGNHNLELETIDSSFNKNKSKKSFKFYVDNVNFKADFLEEEYQTIQGKTIHAKIKSNKNLSSAKIKFLERSYKFYPENEYSKVYECFIPVECELNPGEYLLNAELIDKVGRKVNLVSKANVKPFKFPKQRGFVVEKDKLEEEKEISMSNKILEQAIEKWLEDSTDKKMWSGHFELPIDVKRVSTPFGEIRTSTEKGKYLHKAVDILNFPKSVVWASQNGKIIIKDRFLMTGNTVAIDHGIGIITLYCHLEDFADVEVGDFVKKGNPIGRLGMTGYADGYHLHWELRVNNVAVDPFQWTQKTF